MAIPRVFLSSTCYDLAQVRDSLHAFISGYGFDPCLSDRGDVFYHPDLHTHHSCVNEVSNCHLFILIIGGRFGGSYKIDPTKSIVNAEYAAARELKIPVFTFVRSDVWSNHNFYQSNKSNIDVSKAKFPAIDKPEHASKIFDFIDEVRHAPVNNGFEQFEYSRQIEAFLRKQWAGMVFDQLQERRLRKEQELQQGVLARLTSASEQMEQLVKKIYESVDVKGAPKVIREVEARSEAMDFFRELEAILRTVVFFQSTVGRLLKKPIPNEWQKFLLRSHEFSLTALDVKELNSDATELMNVIVHQNVGDRMLSLQSTGTEASEALHARFKKSYAAFLSLDDAQRRQVLTDFKRTNGKNFSLSDRVAVH